MFEFNVILANTQCRNNAVHTLLQGDFDRCCFVKHMGRAKRKCVVYADSEGSDQT